MLFISSINCHTLLPLPPSYPAQCRHKLRSVSLPRPARRLTTRCRATYARRPLSNPAKRPSPTGRSQPHVSCDGCSMLRAPAWLVCLGACCCWNLSAEPTAGKTSRFLAARRMVFAAVRVCGVDMGPVAVSMSRFDWRLSSMGYYLMPSLPAEPHALYRSQWGTLTASSRKTTARGLFRKPGSATPSWQFKNGLRYFLWLLRGRTPGATGNRLALHRVTYPVDGICYTALSVEVKCGTSARISKPPLGSVRY